MNESQRMVYTTFETLLSVHPRVVRDVRYTLKMKGLPAINQSPLVQKSPQSLTKKSRYFVFLPIQKWPPPARTDNRKPMCYHKSLINNIDYLAEYYSVGYSNEIAESYTPHYHENGFDFLPSPVVTVREPKEFQLMNWGLIPWWVKSLPDGLRLRTQTLNCISEEMFDKPSFRDAANDGQRCLIPCSGFFEWRWIDEKGKMKVPYYITLQNQPVFSIAGLFSTWKDKQTDVEYRTYTVLTTKANPYMEKIHNSKKRMPVILPREYEKDWLNPNLTKEDVLALCQPAGHNTMKGYTISKLITSKKEETDVPKVLEPEVYSEIND